MELILPETAWDCDTVIVAVASSLVRLNSYVADGELVVAMKEHGSGVMEALLSQVLRLVVPLQPKQILPVVVELWLTL